MTQELMHQALTCYHDNDLAKAAALCRQALAREPGNADAWHVLGMTAKKQGDIAQAEACLRQALAALPGVDDGMILANLAGILRQAGRPREGEALCAQGMAAGSGHAGLWFQAAECREALGDLAAAEEALRQAMTRFPGLAEAPLNLGGVLHRRNRLTEAEACYRQALALDPGSAVAHYNLGLILGDGPEAIAPLMEALRLRPGYAEALSALLRLRQSLLHWSEAEVLAERLRALIQQDGPEQLFPFAILGMTTTLAEQQRCARKWAVARFGGTFPSPPPLPPRTGRLRLGYLSADLQNHPVSHLIAQVFELHDRTRFEVIAYSAGQDDGGAMRQRLKRAFDHFHDVAGWTDQAVAEQVRRDGIHILVDLGGYTRGSRSGVLALRPAPVQVNFLGYPGTLGAGFADYIVTDDFVTPPGSAPFFDEQFACLPHCYQPNDRHRALPPSPSRQELGLPEHGVVFCCFNHPYKITRAFFDLWCGLLRETPGSVLWLLRFNPWMAETLGREARARGIDPCRIVLAPEAPQELHLARLQQADIFLDTLPYNAHTTASDALWAGVPVVTCVGATFAGRVAGSLNRAAGVPELNTPDLAGYRELALALAHDPARRQAMRQRLREGHTTTPLFDSPGFTVALENLFAQMISRAAAGLPPAPLRVTGEGFRELLLGAGWDTRKRLFFKDRSTWSQLTTLDHNPLSQPDVVWDLNQLPLPFADNSFDEVHAYEVLEHTGRQGGAEFFFAQFSEFWRILKPGGHFFALTPAPGSTWAWGDPSHTRVLQEEQMVFLDQSEYLRQLGHTAMSDFRGIYQADFTPILLETTKETCRFILRAVKPSRVQTGDQSWPEEALRAYQQGDIATAHHACHMAQIREPRRADVRNLMGVLLNRLERREEAKLAYRQAMRLDPTFPEPLSNLGNLLRQEFRFDDALACYRQALALRADFVPALHGMGCTLQALARSGEALTWLERALSQAPDNADLHWDRALALLTLGRLAEGFREYDWRWQRGQPPARGFIQPIWQGEPLDGEILFIHAEQGLGDALQFLRFLPLVTARVKRVILEVHPALARVAHLIPGIEGVVTLGEEPPPFQRWIPLLNLPLVFGSTLETLPGPWFPPLPGEAVAPWRERLAAPGLLRVGLVWAGNPNVKNDALRSPRLGPLRPLLELPGVRFFSLQKGAGRDDLPGVDGITDLDAHLHDFLDTAATASCLDLIITSDTSVAHLVGSLGLKAWVLLPFAADWRWGEQGETTPWYPAMRLFRQESLRDWSGVVARVREALLQLVLATGGDNAELLTLRATRHRQAGELAAAITLLDRAAELAPQVPTCWINLGHALFAGQHWRQAATAYARALALTPGDVALWVRLSDTRRQAGELQTALAAAAKAVALEEHNPQAHNALGNARHALGENDAAGQAYHRALALEPGLAEARYNLGVLLREQDDMAGALACFETVLARNPEFTAARFNAGVVLQGMPGQEARAEALYREVIAAQPAHLGALNNLAAIHLAQGRDDEAEAGYARMLALQPDNLLARVNWLHIRQKRCEWSDIPAMAAVVAQVMALADDETMPPMFPFLCFPIPLEEVELLTLARRYARGFQKGITPLSPPAPGPRQRLRIGYVSADFHNHATAHLMLGLFKRHDRARFEIIAYSFGPDDGSAYRQRIREECDAFVEVAPLAPRAMAERIRADGIDILVDLKGYTRSCRPAIFAHRPAPVQVQYLGYPGTMGADFIDYVITDRWVTPPEQQECYTETFAYLPHSYQVNDDEQPIALPMPTRAACGLPETGIVFTCFCAPQKLEPMGFGAWMAILAAVPGSVLWLLDGSAAMQERLRQAAATADIAPERLLFAPVWPKDRHLARLRHADLFLDTLFYNGHTTASDALWAGVPVITWPGRTFAQRVGESLVRAVGLPELVVGSLAEYQAMAIDLALDPERLADLKARLRRNVRTAPLFDTARFTRDLEACYMGMWRDKGGDVCL